MFLDDATKNSGSVDSLREGCKGIVIENLGGCLEQLDKLRYASKLILVEGFGDLDFLNNICPRYESWATTSSTGNVIVKMDGIDTLNGKLISYARAIKRYNSINL